MHRDVNAITNLQFFSETNEEPWVREPFKTVSVYKQVESFIDNNRLMKGRNRSKLLNSRKLMDSGSAKDIHLRWLPISTKVPDRIDVLPHDYC